MPPTDFLSCDWGTTSFRLRWVSGPRRQVLRQIHEKAGIKAMIERAGTGDTATFRSDVFAHFLRAKLEELLSKQRPPERRLPLVISGMASSSVGWRELPYAQTPFLLDGSSLISQELDWDSPKWVEPTHLISGAATRHNMMRGEECEIIGLLTSPSLAALQQQCLVILPGTHSKHVRIQNGSVMDWRTYMTGELFEVLGEHSLLRASLDFSNASRSKSFVDAHQSGFIEGVRAAQELGLAAGLFHVRSRAVLDRVNAVENTAFFSGLLIGAELLEIAKEADEKPVLLAGTGSLGDSYACAMEIIANASVHWSQAPADQVENATIRAHALFLATKAGA